MKKLNLILYITLVTALFFAADAQTLKTGTTSAQILKINVGPRAIGMGGAFTSIADDITSVYWNPSGTANIQSNEVYFNHSNLYLDISNDFAAISTNVSGFGSIGAFVSVLSVDEMLVRTVEQPEGTGEYFDYGSIVVGLNYARFLTENFSIGFNAKYISESIWNMSATGFALDVGTLYKIPVLNELRIAASVSNFGTKMQLAGRDVTELVPAGAGGGNYINSNLELGKFDLPLLFRFGISADVVKEGTSRLTVAVDAIHPNDHTEYINSGLEYAWNEIIHIRAGYNSLFEKDSEKGLTFGFGLNYRIVDLIKVKLDYAYQDFGRLSEVHYFSVGINF
ncbi:MAG TPA: PorV/PorQ family protein [Ignavibacteriaceae bacterium]|jgi:opacity protein-like surface antigen